MAKLTDWSQIRESVKVLKSHNAKCKRVEDCFKNAAGIKEDIKN
jgi:hypothetical protein